MNIYAFTTGTVSITQNWQQGHGSYPARLARTLMDTRFTEPLPIWCFLVEHPEGLILIDTGIPSNANAPVWFPPHIRLAQRAAPFQIANTDDEIGNQLRANGFSPDDVRWVVLTHLHQDHEGGLHHFPNAEFIVSRREWQASQGLKGQLGGYLNFRWFDGFQPTLINFDETDTVFDGHHTLTQAGDVVLVPTHGHSAVSADAPAVHKSHRHILNFAAQTPTVYLPSHEWAAQDRLAEREVISRADLAKVAFLRQNT
jgi:N-acyl homoserine lactone hydrolase